MLVKVDLVVMVVVMMVMVVVEEEEAKILSMLGMLYLMSKRATIGIKLMTATALLKNLYKSKKP
jgi:hypothetical protein